MNGIIIVISLKIMAMAMVMEDVEAMITMVRVTILAMGIDMAKATVITS